MGPKARWTDNLSKELANDCLALDADIHTIEFNHLLVVVKHLEPFLGIEGVAEHLDIALLQPILGVEELQPILSVTGNQLVDAAVLLANGVEGRAL